MSLARKYFLSNIKKLGLYNQNVGRFLQNVKQQRILIWKNYKYVLSPWPQIGGMSLLLYTASCEDKLDITSLEPETLTHGYLIKQSLIKQVDAATQLLTLTVIAVLDTNEKYRITLEKLIALTEEGLQTINMSSYQDVIWEQVIEFRNEMDDLKKTLLELSTFMEYVEKTATSAAETSFLAGAEYASTAMCERINSAQQQLRIELDKTKHLEEELLKIQESHVYKASKFDKNKKGSRFTQIVDQLTKEEQ